MKLSFLLILGIFLFHFSIPTHASSLCDGLENKAVSEISALSVRNHVNGSGFSGAGIDGILRLRSVWDDRINKCEECVADEKSFNSINYQCEGKAISAYFKLLSTTINISGYSVNVYDNLLKEEFKISLKNEAGISQIEDYVGGDIVINMGADGILNYGDKLILKDTNIALDIWLVSKIKSNSSLMVNLAENKPTLPSLKNHSEFESCSDYIIHNDEYNKSLREYELYTLGLGIENSDVFKALKSLSEIQLDLCKTSEDFLEKEHLYEIINNCDISKNRLNELLSHERKIKGKYIGNDKYTESVTRIILNSLEAAVKVYSDSEKFACGQNEPSTGTISSKQESTDNETLNKDEQGQMMVKKGQMISNYSENTPAIIQVTNTTKDKSYYKEIFKKKLEARMSKISAQKLQSISTKINVIIPQLAGDEGKESTLLQLLALGEIIEEEQSRRARFSNFKNTRFVQ